jgi:hypothetical protein
VTGVQTCALPIYEDHVDVAGTKGDALLENLRTFVDDGKNRAFDDFLRGNDPLWDAGIPRALPYALNHNRIGNWLAVARPIPIPSSAALLAFSTPSLLMDI